MEMTVMQLLMEAGANKEVKDEHGMTALIHAAIKGEMSRCATADPWRRRHGGQV